MTDLDLFDYSFSDNLVALNPLKNKEQAKMLVYEKKSFVHKKVGDLINFLTENDLLVFNNTSVLPCRLKGIRSRKTAGKSAVAISVTLNKYIEKNLWSVFCNPLKKLTVGDIITFSKSFSAKVISIKSGLCIMRFIYSEKDFIFWLKKTGYMPIPPYIEKKRGLQKTDFTAYQTPFAKIDGSVAAPTASLHFSDELIKKIERKNIPHCYVTLHISGGTFMPIRVKNIDNHIMHSEYANVKKETALKIRNTIRKGGRVIAVGTTVMRVLESSLFVNNNFCAFEGDIDTFIKPGHDFKVCSGLFTNFHQPKSTLFVLVNAFIGSVNASELYSLALKNRYRLFSYGDCCLLIP